MQSRTVSKIKACRFIAQNAPFCAMKRPVSHAETCRLASQNGTFCNPTDSQLVTETARTDRRVAKNKGLPAATRARVCGSWRADWHEKYVNISILTNSLEKRSACPLLFQRQCKRVARELALICPSAAWPMQRRGRGGLSNTMICNMTDLLLGHCSTNHHLPSFEKGGETCVQA